MSSNLNNNFEAIFSRLEGFVTTKTVIGEAISMGDVIILPLVDVSFGVGAASVEVPSDKEKGADTGGGGAGAKITPSAVLVINKGNVQLVNVKNQDSISKLIDLAPGVISKLNLGGIFGKNKETEQATEPETDLPSEE